MQEGRDEPAMSTDAVQPPLVPWPRFTGVPSAEPPREPGVAEPWPRWGWFPREARTWSFAPGPSLTAASSPPPVPPPAPPAVEASPPPAVLPPPRERIPEVGDVRPAEGGRDVELVPVRRSTSTALVTSPRGGEVTLLDLARAAKRMAPLAAVAGMAAAAAVALFRRK